MIIKYEINNEFMKSHLEKYLKASDEKISFLDKYILKYKKDYTTNEERELEIFDKYIIYKVNKDEEYTISLLSIEDIVIDNNDIMIINFIKAIFIPSYAFDTDNDRLEFIDKLKKNLKITKLNIKREIVNSENGYYISDRRSSDKFITLSKGYTKPHSSYCSDRLLAYKNLYNPLKNSIFLRCLFWILVSCFFVFLGFNFMGSFTKTIFYFGLFSGVLILILAFYFIFLYKSIKIRNEYLNSVSRDKFKNVNFKLEVFEGNIFIDENDSILGFKISNLVRLEKKKRGLFLVFKDRKNNLIPYLFYKAKNISENDINEIFYTLKTMQNYYEDSFEKIEKLKTVPEYYFKIKRVFFILAIVAFPLTLFIVPKVMPNYYAKITQAKHLEQMQKAQSVIDANLYSNTENFNM
ncbi:MAG: hypothetical protein ACRC57_03875 [Sarcina sp.]